MGATDAVNKNRFIITERNRKWRSVLAAHKRASRALQIALKTNHAIKLAVHAHDGYFNLIAAGLNNHRVISSFPGISASVVSIYAYRVLMSTGKMRVLRFLFVALPGWRRRSLGMIRPCYKPIGNLVRYRQSPARPLSHGAFGVAKLPGKSPLGPVQQG